MCYRYAKPLTLVCGYCYYHITVTVSVKGGVTERTGEMGRACTALITGPMFHVVPTNKVNLLTTSTVALLRLGWPRLRTWCH